MLCSRCGANVAEGAAFCPGCGTPLGGAAGLGSMQHRRAAALTAFESGQDAAGVQCPNCGEYRMQPVRIDADATMIAAFICLVVGGVALGLVLLGGDVGLYIADASAVAVALIVAGIVLWLVARRRRKPRAYECFSCGYRVP